MKIQGHQEVKKISGHGDYSPTGEPRQASTDFNAEAQ